MKFYIFRHGQSTFNTLGKVQGHTNSSILTDLGKKQALTVGQRLIDKNIDVIITSPLKRALETAEICNQLLKKPIVIDDAFIEVNVGEIEGLHHTEVSDKFGEKYDRWRSNSPKYLVADSGYYTSEIIDIKTIKNKKHIVLAGGTNHLRLPHATGVKHKISIIERNIPKVFNAQESIQVSYKSKLSGFNKKSFNPIVVIPFSSCLGIILSLTMTTFLNESLIPSNGRSSCACFSGVGIEKADCM